MHQPTAEVAGHCSALAVLRRGELVLWTPPAPDPVAALAATMEAAEAADRRRPLATPGVPRGKKKQKKQPLPAKAVAMPVKAAPKPAKAAAKPAKAAQPAAEAKVAKEAKEAKEARPAEGSGYAIEPDDPQLLKTLTSLGAQDTAQFAVVQKALKELAAHQEEREDANSLASLQP